MASKNMSRLSAKALLVTSSFLPGNGGIERYLAGLCDQLKPDLAVMATPKRGGKPLPTDLPYPVRALPSQFVTPSRKVAEAIKQFCEELGTNKVLFGTSWPLGMLGPRLKKEGTSYAIMMHGSELWTIAKVPILKRYLAQALAEAETLFSVSVYTAGKAADLLLKYGLKVPPTKILPVYVDTAKFKPLSEESKIAARKAWGIAADDKVVLHLSRLYKRKGATRLVKAWRQIQKAEAKSVLVIAGTGNEYNRLKRMVKARPKQRIILTGSINNEQATELYGMADVFAFPAHDRWFGIDTEGLGIVMLEAAASGLPTVVGRCGGTVEALQNGKTGFLINGEDEEEIVDQITAFLKSPAEARAMGELGRQFVIAKYGNPGAPKPVLEWINSRSE